MTVEWTPEDNSEAWRRGWYLSRHSLEIRSSLDLKKRVDLSHLSREISAQVAAAAAQAGDPLSIKAVLYIAERKFHRPHTISEF